MQLTITLQDNAVFGLGDYAIANGIFIDNDPQSGPDLVLAAQKMIGDTTEKIIRMKYKEKKRAVTLNDMVTDLQN